MLNESYAKLNIVKRNLSELKPHPQNPRQHPEGQKQALLDSLDLFEYTKGSIVIQKSTQRLLAGHLVTKSLLEKGYSEADIVEIDCDDKTALAFLTADNQYALLADWDVGQLDDNLMELEELDFNLGELGFDLEPIKDFSDIDGKEYDESIADEVEMITCPKCGHEFPE